MDKGAAVWNPWFKQSRWIKVNASQPSSQVVGVGYSTKPYQLHPRKYKTMSGSRYRWPYWTEHSEWETQDFSSEVWKDPKLTPRQGDKSLKDKVAIFFTRCGVSLHGNVYWIAFYDKTDTLYHLLNFDFSSERFYAYFCDLPCGMNHPRNALVVRSGL
ncbi:unnamed protein product [Brassica oleracea]